METQVHCIIEHRNFNMLHHLIEPARNTSIML